MIKATKGVENVVLTQRDGNPIQYSGIWFSQNEIFSVSAATSAIYNCGIELHKDQLKYILIEGPKAKILLSPLRNYGTNTINKIIEAQGLQGNDDNFFIAISAMPNINLGGIFLKTKNALIEIKKALILSGESFKPPLRKFSNDELEELLNSLDTKDELNNRDTLEIYSFNLNENAINDLKKILNEFVNRTIGLTETFVSINGGYVLASYVKDDWVLGALDNNATMSNTLFTTADKYAWLLKKMQINSILLECNEYFQFINRVENGIFSTRIKKGSQKLGLLRLIIPRYCKRISNVLKEIYQNQIPENFELNFTELFEEITF